MKSSTLPDWVVRPLVPEAVYTDRQEFIDYFYMEALKAASRRAMSTVFLGQRRMGKTEIFKRVVNRLFFEQDPKSPDAAAPVYFSFPDTAVDEKRFATDYVENFLRYYVGFYTRQPDIVTEDVRGEKLLAKIEQSRSLYPFTRTLDMILHLREDIETGNSILPHRDALGMPRRVSDIDESTIVVFLDEFQNTRLPQYNFDIAGCMQEAVESPTCPHFVTGSAMSILAREIIGRGSLFGRFDSHEIEGMTGYWGTKLALNAAKYYRADIPEIIAPAIAERCGGNPFYINALVRQSAKLNEPIADEEKLNKILAVDISSGFIWGELNDQVSRWIERVNEHKITKWVLYLSALEENEDKDRGNELNLERIQRTIREREGGDVSLETIRDVLVRLSRGDLVEYLELGDWFRRVKDPILRAFLKVWGKIEVEGLGKAAVRETLVDEYQGLKRRISEYKGYLAEVHMSQILLNLQNKTLPGWFLHSDADIPVPYFVYVRQRVRLGSGKGREIDVYGAGPSEKWICQSKWVTGQKIGMAAMNELMAQADIVRREKNPKLIRLWLFAHDGLTPDAEKFAADQDVFWSTRKEFDALLSHAGLRSLPDLD